MSLLFALPLAIVSAVGSSGFSGPADAARKVSFEFLRRHGGDAEKLSDEFLYERVDQALSTRTQFPWSSQIPELLFLNDVLPYGVLREPRDAWWRAGPLGGLSGVANLADFAKSLVQHCGDITCAAMALNTAVWNITEPAIVFEAAPANTLNSYGVFETAAKKKSSCTGLSIFLVSALRSVVIPARLAGTPHWSRGRQLCPHGDSDPACGNHNWVEVWVPEAGGWSFIDQRRPDFSVLPLNQSFFSPLQTNEQRGQDALHSIYASSFATTYWLANMGAANYPAGRDVEPADHFAMVWDLADLSVAAWDVTRAYWRPQPEAVPAPVLAE